MLEEVKICFFINPECHKIFASVTVNKRAFFPIVSNFKCLYLIKVAVAGFMKTIVGFQNNKKTCADCVEAIP